MAQISLRAMRVDDVPEVTRIHLAAFPGFFLSFLGPRFLTELYTAVLADPSGIAFIAEAPDGVAGFVAGSLEPAGFYGRLVRHRLVRFALASVPALLRRPIVAPRLIRALTMARQGERPEGSAMLMSIAVDPGRQRTGAGRALTIAFLDACRLRGALSVRLTTDQRENDDAHAFYRRLGFDLCRTYETPEGRAMSEYGYSLVAQSETVLR